METLLHKQKYWRYCTAKILLSVLGVLSIYLVLSTCLLPLCLLISLGCEWKACFELPSPLQKSPGFCFCVTYLVLVLVVCCCEEMTKATYRRVYLSLWFQRLRVHHGREACQQQWKMGVYVLYHKHEAGAQLENENLKTPQALAGWWCYITHL